MGVHVLYYIIYIGTPTFRYPGYYCYMSHVTWPYENFKIHQTDYPKKNCLPPRKILYSNVIDTLSQNVSTYAGEFTNKTYSETYWSHFGGFKYFTYFTREFSCKWKFPTQAKGSLLWSPALEGKLFPWPNISVCYIQGCQTYRTLCLWERFFLIFDVILIGQFWHRAFWEKLNGSKTVL